VSDELLPTEFKRGLGSEAGADAMRDAEEEEVAAAAAGVGPRPLAPRNLGELLAREGLMLTHSAAR
jgi:hypothetical protein